MSAIDWEHAPEIAKPTYEELEAMCWELTEQNAELRKLVRDLYIDLAAILGDGLWMEPYENEMVELGVDFDG